MYSGSLYLIQGTLDRSPLLQVDREHWLASQGETCSCHWAKSASLTLTFSVERVNSPVFFASPHPAKDKCIPLLLCFLPSHINSQTHKHLEPSLPGSFTSSLQLTKQIYSLPEQPMRGNKCSWPPRKASLLTVHIASAYFLCNVTTQHPIKHKCNSVACSNSGCSL